MSKSTIHLVDGIGSVATKPIIAITLGDPSGVGPEVAVQALAHPRVRRSCIPIPVGHPDILGRAARLLRIRLDPGIRESMIPIAGGGASTLKKKTPAAGRAACLAVEAAVRLVLFGQADAMATAPIDKTALRRAGYPFAGHTEILAKMTCTARPVMGIAIGRLRIFHISSHLSLREAVTAVQPGRILETLDAARRFLAWMGIPNPRIAVAGLNPHAGEGGMFGNEEQKKISPAIRRARERGWDVTGPHPPDTVFTRGRAGEFDGVVAMYHDQGHIAAKTLDFNRGVAFTAGLPIIRTSAAHGTAHDIAWRGKASSQSMREAILLAARLVRGKQKRPGGGLSKPQG